MRFTALLMLTLSSSVALAQDATEAPFAEQSAALERTLERLGKIDVKHPDYLAAELDLAQLLARNTSGDDCAARLPLADSYFKAATASPVLPLVLRGARGRVAVVGYYLEMARARCADEAHKTAAQQAALKYARDAVAGYREMFMYEPMAIMQFSVAQALHDLGDDAGARLELKTALDFDRTFGFQADAEQNFRALNAWQGKQVSDEEVAAFIAPYAPRRVTLTFGWTPSKVEASTSFDAAAYEGPGVRHTRYTLPVTSTLRADQDAIVCESSVGAPKLDPANAGDDAEKKMFASMTRILAQSPPLVLSKTGEFKEVRDADAFSQRLNAELDAALLATIPEKDPRFAATKASVDRELKPLATPANLSARAQQDFALQTGLWSGATLDQYGWVRLPLTLSMNGTPQGYIEHTVEATFTRRVPCTAGGAPEGCVELVLEAVPTQKAVADAAQRLQDSNQGRLDYAAATRMRLVVDPATMLTYAQETVRFTYLALANKGQRVLKIENERAETGFKYRK